MFHFKLLINCVLISQAFSSNRAIFGLAEKRKGLILHLFVGIKPKGVAGSLGGMLDWFCSEKNKAIYVSANPFNSTNALVLRFIVFFGVSAG